MAAAAEQIVRVQIPEAFAGLFDPQYRFYVYKGGRGGGRSESVAAERMIASTQRRLKGLCCREYQNSIKDSVKSVLEKKIEQYQLPGWKSTRDELTNHNGSLIIFDGLHNNTNSIKSKTDLDWAWVEEAEGISKKSLNTLIPTVRNPGSKLYFTYNPESETSAIHQKFIVKPPKRCLVVHTTWRDNPFFPDELREEMEHDWETDPDLARHKWDGEFYRISNAEVFYGKWVQQRFEPGENWRGPFYGADFGFSSDPSTLVENWIHENDLYIRHAAFGWKVETAELPALYCGVRPDIRKYPIIADSARPETISYLKNLKDPETGEDRSFLIRGAQKGPGSVEDGIAYLRSFNRIVIHPDCKHMIEEAKGYKYKVNKDTEEPTRILVDAYNHGWDAVRYALEPMIRKRQAWGVS